MRIAYLAGWLALGIASQAAWGQGGAVAPGPAPTTQAQARARVRAVIDNMDKAVSLTDEQKKKMQDMLDEQQTALAAWQKANGEKLKAALEAMTQARESEDEAAARKAMDQWKEVIAGQTELLKKYDITTVLTPEQKAKWAAARLLQNAQWQYRAAKLTDAQTAKVKAAAEELAKKVDLADPKSHMEAMAALDAKVQELLTDEQKQAVQASITPYSMPASRPAPATKPMPPVAPPVPPPDKAVGGGA